MFNVFPFFLLIGSIFSTLSLLYLYTLAKEPEPIKTPLFPLRAYGYLGYDAGRVWIDEDESNRIHQSYGGGFNMSMSGALKAGLSYFYGAEKGRLSFYLTFGI